MELPQPTLDITPKDTSNTEDLNNISDKGIAPKTLSLWMSRQEAENNGLLRLFDQYNINNKGNSRDRIDETEYAAYNDIREISETKSIEQITEMALESIGIGAQKIAEINKLRNDENKEDLTTVTRKRLGIDLSKCKTEQEKQNLISKAINKKYSYNTRDKNSVYAQHIQRLRAGQLTESEKKLLGERDSITDEFQLAKFAQMATDADAIVEIAQMLAVTDEAGQTNLIKTMGNYKSNIQTGLLAIAVYSSENIETRKEFANLLINKVKLKLSDTNKENFHIGTYAIARYTNQRDYMRFVTDFEHFVSASAQTAAFMMSDAAENDKVRHGDLSNEEYNNNYVNTLAASAHMLQEASKAYKYVMDNANDKNRSATINMLASTAYQIQDESERNKAIGAIQSSPYYNDSTAKKLNESFDKYISQKTENSSTSTDTHASSTYVTNPSINSSKEEHNDFNNIVSKAFENDDEKSTLRKEITQKTVSDLEEKNKTPEFQRISRERGIQLLNILIKENKLSDKQKNMMINKLKSLPDQTLVTLITLLDSKAQNYLVENNVVKISKIIELLGDTDQKNLADNIQDKIQETKREKMNASIGRKLDIDYA